MANTQGGQRLRELFRRAPIGVLALAALLGVVGGGLVAGGTYLLVSGDAARAAVWGSVLLLGPLTLYVALSLVRLTRWAWLTAVALLTMLTASSLLRLLVGGGAVMAPLAELAAEALVLLYLLRPRVRSAFRAA